MQIRLILKVFNTLVTHFHSEHFFPRLTPRARVTNSTANSTGLLTVVEKSSNNYRRCLYGLSCMGGDLADLINMADCSEWKGHAKIF